MKDIDVIINDFKTYIGGDGNIERVMRVHLSLLLKWQKIVNLIGVTSEREIAEFLYLDSFIALKNVAEFLLTRRIDIEEVSDIGSGAGFPSLFWFYFLPDVRVVLFESKRKKANFLREFIREAELKNYEIREEMVMPKRLQTDMIISKAAMPISNWTRFGISNVKKRGIVVSLLSAGSLSVYNKSLEKTPQVFESYVKEYRLPYSNTKREIAIIIKK